MNKSLRIWLSVFVFVLLSIVDVYGCAGFADCKKQAKQGNAEAQYNLGQMYDFGEGVTQDYKEAVKWYRQAAYQGYAKAQNNLGVMYYKGYGVEQDYSRAHLFWNIASANGDTDARKNMVEFPKKMTRKQISKAQKMDKE